ncbi:MAG TPA: ABC transporter substrate-binding protein [Actinomycetota bacterium]|nr:ABC transporter substrate-binding protein [Actinomycetota bacterium]
MRPLAALAFTAFLLPVACVRTGPPSAGSVPERSAGVVVGAFNFSESAVLAEVYAHVLDEHGVDAEVLREVASREIMEPALEQGEVDLVPEYLGTALTFLGDHEVDAEVAPEEAHALLGQDFAGRGVTVLDAAPGQNRNEIVVTESFAAEHELDTIADLARVDQDATFGGPVECPARPLCLAGLEEVYGLRFREFLPLDSGGPATVAALAAGEVDVALLFTTNPQIPRRDLVILEDDRHLQPPENLVPVMRTETADALAPAVLDAVDAVTALLSDEELRELNGLVEIKGLTPREAAASWLESQGQA